MITRRRFALACASALAAGPVFAAEESGSGKKGWCGSNKVLHDLFGVKWYYNWTPSKGKGTAEFVPLFKYAGNVSEGMFKKVRSYEGGSAVLGFNEPDRKKQGNLSVKRAIELWPQLVKLAEEKNLRIGSPATASDPEGIAWLKEFMDQAKSKKLRVDFIAAHWYGTPNADEFKIFVGQMTKGYRLPVWITEFNGWSGSEADNYDFLKDALRFLERERDVERYAYFNPNSKSPLALVNEKGEPTRMGALYRDA